VFAALTVLKCVLILLDANTARAAPCLTGELLTAEASDSSSSSKESESCGLARVPRVMNGLSFSSLYITVVACRLGREETEAADNHQHLGQQKKDLHIVLTRVCCASCSLS